MAKLSLQIEGMHCGSCVRRVTQTLNAVPETHAEQVEIGSARISTGAPAGDIVQALKAAGFTAQARADQ